MKYYITEKDCVAIARLGFLALGAAFQDTLCKERDCESQKVNRIENERVMSGKPRIHPRKPRQESSRHP